MKVVSTYKLIVNHLLSNVRLLTESSFAIVKFTTTLLQFSSIFFSKTS